MVPEAGLAPFEIDLGRAGLGDHAQCGLLQRVEQRGGYVIDDEVAVGVVLPFDLVEIHRAGIVLDGTGGVN